MPTRIALLGDEQGHPTHRELNAVRGMLGHDVTADWVPTESAQARDLQGFDGVWLVPGSPYADEAAVYEAIRWARENDVPFLGTCAGMQYAVIEFCRNVLGITDASHAESGGLDESNVIVPLACSLQGQQRLVRPVAGTRFAALVDAEPFIGTHYCSYAPDPAAIEKLVAAGMIVSATADDAGAEVLEWPANRFYKLSLFQPHIGALAGEPLHPLLAEFVRSARSASGIHAP